MSLLDAGARRMRFILVWAVVTAEGAEKATVTLSVGTDRPRQAVGVNSVRLRVAEVFVAGVVDDRGVGAGVTTEEDAGHSVCLVVGAARPPIFLCVKVAHGEQWQPSVAVSKRAMHEHEGTCKSVTTLGWDVIHYLLRCP